MLKFEEKRVSKLNNHWVDVAVGVVIGIGVGAVLT